MGACHTPNSIHHHFNKEWASHLTYVILNSRFVCEKNKIKERHLTEKPVKSNGIQLNLAQYLIRYVRNCTDIRISIKIIVK